MRKQHVILRCPHCDTAGQHPTGDLVGDWVVCDVCELPFAWDGAAVAGGNNGRRARAARRAQLNKPHSKPRDEG